MATGVIFGAGVMGSATAFPLCDNGHKVRLVGTHLDGEIIEQVKTRRYHPTLRRELPPHVRGYEHGELSEALEDADFIVSGVNSCGVRWAAATLAGALKRSVPIIAITKGLDIDDDGTILTLNRVYEKTLAASGGPECTVSGIGGPCIAGELAARRPSCVVFASAEKKRSEWFTSLFRTPYYHIWPSADLFSLEISAALKNAYTLAVAIAAGFLPRPESADAAGAQMHNPAAAAFGQGVNEMGYILEALGGCREFAASLPGAGDFYVTCAGGRNLRLGGLLGSGNTLKQARSHMEGVTIESLSIIAAMARALPRLYARSILDPKRLPLMEYLIQTVESGVAKPLPLGRFFPEIA